MPDVPEPSAIPAETLKILREFQLQPQLWKPGEITEWNHPMTKQDVSAAEDHILVGVLKTVAPSRRGRKSLDLD